METHHAFNRAHFEERDANDPLAQFYDAFDLPEGVIYLDGNSLGPAPRRAMARARDIIEKEWGQGLIRSWNSSGWFEAPSRIGAKIAQLIGARPDEVVATDTTCSNLFKLVAAALALRPDRSVIVMEESNFPTDNYMVQGLISLLGQSHEIRFCEQDDLEAAIDHHVAAICLTDVHYKTGHVLDMKRLTSKAHDAGALAIWDLCHSAGAIPVDLNAANADFAVGCTYKYLNGGPGAPAFLFAAKRHHDKASQPLSGWWGHAEPFAFERDFRRRHDIKQFLTSTQPMISLLVAEVGIDLFLEADLSEVRQKSMALTELFIELVEDQCGAFGFNLESPRDASVRGSQVSFSHPDGYPIMKALIAQDVIGDFRAPDAMRFGFAPLYTRYTDVYDAVQILKKVMITDEWKKSEYSERDAVT